MGEKKTHKEYSMDVLMAMSNGEFSEAVYQAVLIDSNLEDSEECRKKMLIGIPESEPETIRFCVVEDGSLSQRVQVHPKQFWVDKLLNARHIDSDSPLQGDGDTGKEGKS